MRFVTVLLLTATLWGTLVGAQTTAEGDRPDVLLITIDTLRADALGFAGNTEVETPNMDRLADRGRVFTDAHGHNVITLPSHANILTGRYPYQHGIRENDGFRLDGDIPTLATVLKGAGYATAAFVGAFPLDSAFGLDRGFDTYDDHYPKGGRDRAFVLPERPGQEVVALALDWWTDHTDRPRFLWVHLFDPHAPYEPPEPFASQYAKAPYLGEVAATDAHLAPLLDAAAQAQALVVLTSDHGESLGEHGELTHGLFAYEATLKVPLVVAGPGIDAARDDRAARHVDIFPTVLDAVDLPLPGGFDFPGRSLLEGAPEAPVSTYFEAMSASLNRGWAPLYGQIVERQKLIVLPLPELYDLVQDPRETHNRVREDRATAAALRDSLPPRPRVWPTAAPQGPSDPAVAEQLRSLGYLGGSAAIRDTYTAEDDPKNLVTLDLAMHQSIEHYARGDIDAALTLARRVVDERPSMALGQSLLAQALLEAGQPQAAIEAMSKALEIGATTPALVRQLGLTLAEAGQHARALEVLGPLGQSDDTADLNALALALSEAGRHAEAQATLDRSLGLDADNPSALEQLSLVHLRRQQWTAARDAARRALDLNDSLARAWNNLGVAHAGLGEIEPAIDAWGRAVDLDPTLFDALYNLGTRALDAGRIDVAKDALRRFVDGAPEDAYATDLRRARVLLRRLERRQGS